MELLKKDKLQKIYIRRYKSSVSFAWQSSICDSQGRFSGTVYQDPLTEAVVAMLVLTALCCIRRENFSSTLPQ